MKAVMNTSRKYSASWHVLILGPNTIMQHRLDLGYRFNYVWCLSLSTPLQITTTVFP